MNTPTPETDSEAYKTWTEGNCGMGDEYADEVVDANFARKLERERNQLRKVCDELAFHLACTHKETGCQSQCATIAVLNNYNSLPHVIAQKGTQ